MRMDHNYSAYNNWSRLIILGVVPFVLLVTFNARIYSGISERSSRRRRRRQECPSANATASAAAPRAPRRTATTPNVPLPSIQPQSSNDRKAIANVVINEPIPNPLSMVYKRHRDFSHLCNFYQISHITVPYLILHLKLPKAYFKNRKRVSWSLAQSIIQMPLGLASSLSTHSQLIVLERIRLLFSRGSGYLAFSTFLPAPFGM